MNTSPAIRQNTKANSKSTSSVQRVVLYARVSTEEQTKGSYPSCESQVEELEYECAKQGWQVTRVIKDEGYSAGSMRRPGLTELRMLVQADQVDRVLCTWYDRLSRSRDFYILDHEFRTHSVRFMTLHDATDTRTAAGRFMESVIVAAKTYDRDQTSEKVCTKMRMRLEKGLHQGGLVPFGFLCDAETKLLTPDPNKTEVIRQIFQTYVDAVSDFAVRDWLKGHHIPSPEAKPSGASAPFAMCYRTAVILPKSNLTAEIKKSKGSRNWILIAL
jgi:site-specific DNA recombinase